MLIYVIKRLLLMIPTLAIISVISFWVINLPPGNYVDAFMAQMAGQGQIPDIETRQQLEALYGVNQPLYVQYYKWITRALRGDFGQSFEWRRPVVELLGDRMWRTIAISLVTIVFVYLVAIPIGIFSALYKYSLWDYLLTFIGFIGLSIPNFSLALIMLYIGFEYFNMSVGGLFSPAYENAPWSIAKFLDLLAHLWVPIIVVGTSGTAGLIRVTRANLLDELDKQYVVAARARGMPRRQLLWKYPVRVAMNPVISSAAFILPAVVSGATITAIVLNLPTTGPIYLRALQSQDMYVAGAFILLLSTLTVIGTLLSDLLLAWADPRIRFGGQK
ncbi:MAG: ABC transporter permease [Caldilineaceae bacterium]|nr:ABC transporter permease [Caldilineaceae bacterium]